MPVFKKPFQQVLFDSFLVGTSVAEAARLAQVSQPTARKFRDEHQEELRELRAKTTEGVLESLKDLLPDTVKRLKAHVDNAALDGVAETVKLSRAVFDCFDVMRDVEYEKRLKHLEQKLADFEKGAQGGKTPNPQPK